MSVSCSVSLGGGVEYCVHESEKVRDILSCTIFLYCQ